jgi:hypothetical protein
VRRNQRGDKKKKARLDKIKQKDLRQNYFLPHVKEY